MVYSTKRKSVKLAKENKVSNESAVVTNTLLNSVIPDKISFLLMLINYKGKLSDSSLLKDKLSSILPVKCM